MKIIAFVFIYSFIIVCHSVNAQSSSGLDVKVNAERGTYVITSKKMRWSFIGSIGHSLTNLAGKHGDDPLGKYKEVRFSWKTDIPYAASIRWYTKKSVIIFSVILPEGSAVLPAAFPSFTTLPRPMHAFSYADDVFAPPQFKLNQTSTPWLFFNDKAEAYIISPASDFMISRLTGNEETRINSSMNAEIKNLHPGFVHKTILVLGQGIGKTWDLWGK
ncbi:MAG: hypothetical protein KGJ59_13960, partial [Bacteroidota bacterium]|nr:hypothetical protein [Bacteroidota bacterium]